jgi:hypothetical protein
MTQTASTPSPRLARLIRDLAYAPPNPPTSANWSNR